MAMTEADSITPGPSTAAEGGGSGDDDARDAAKKTNNSFGSYSKITKSEERSHWTLPIKINTVGNVVICHWAALKSDTMDRLVII